MIGGLSVDRLPFDGQSGTRTLPGSLPFLTPPAAKDRIGPWTSPGARANRTPLRHLPSRAGSSAPAMAQETMVESGLEAVFLEQSRRPAALPARARCGRGAEDLLQEMWIKASAGATGPIADPLAYLYRAANNLMLDRRRAEMRGRGATRIGTMSAAGSRQFPKRPTSERALIAREQLEDGARRR